MSRGMRIAVVVAVGGLGAIAVSTKAGSAQQVIERTAVRCARDSVPVPAGSFWMGSVDDAGEEDERPRTHVTLNRFCMDRTEVTTRSYDRCVSDGACSEPRSIDAEDEPFCNWRQPGRGDHPINCITWFQAEAYCRWAGKRLPTEAEWEYAARGTDEREYPWGNERPTARRLNAAGGERDDDRERWVGIQPLFEASDGWRETAPVGSYRAGRSPFGVLDMAGNVFEWTADWYANHLSGGTVTNPQGPDSGEYRVIRSSSYFVRTAQAVRAAHRGGARPTNAGSVIGVRCAM